MKFSYIIARKIIKYEKLIFHNSFSKKMEYFCGTCEKLINGNNYYCSNDIRFCSVKCSHPNGKTLILSGFDENSEQLEQRSLPNRNPRRTLTSDHDVEEIDDKCTTSKIDENGLFLNEHNHSKGKTVIIFTFSSK